MAEAARWMNSVTVHTNLNYADLPCQGFLYVSQPQKAPSRETFLKRDFKGNHFD